MPRCSFLKEDLPYKIASTCVCKRLALLKGNPDTQRQLGRTFDLDDEVRGSAVSSDCGNYRPYLSRSWGAGPTILWLCMNPSSATDELDDATSQKLTRHSRRLGFGRLFLLNVMDYRATDPVQLPEGEERSVENLNHIRHCARHSDCVALAYGGLRKNPSWIEYARDALEVCRREPICRVATNRDGSPRHPRRFPAIFELQPNNVN